MTRNQFIEEVNCWSELLGFCYDYDCSYCEDVYNEDSKNDYFDSELVEYAKNAEDWQDMLEYLQNIPTGGDYYIKDDYDEWSEADDDDFDNYKDAVLEWGDNGEVWDEEEDEEEYYDPDGELVDESYYEEDGEEELEEGCTLGELFSESASKLQIIEQIEERKREEADKFFEELIELSLDD